MAFPAEPKITSSVKLSTSKAGKVYIWELPVRIFHWINVLAILVLLMTGLPIGSGNVSGFATDDPATSIAMTRARYVHFVAAIVFTINLLIRLYWVFIGNEHAKSNPLRKAFWQEIWDVIKYYLFLKKDIKHSLGHNALAQLSYWICIGAGSIIMMMTGYYMLTEANHDSFLGTITSWIPNLLGLSSFTIRSIHHLLAWAVVIFAMIHIYMAYRDSWLQKNETIKSIFTGYKKADQHIEK